jgi:hypothetical protein
MDVARCVSHATTETDRYTLHMYRAFGILKSRSGESHHRRSLLFSLNEKHPIAEQLRAVLATLDAFMRRPAAPRIVAVDPRLDATKGLDCGLICWVFESVVVVDVDHVDVNLFRIDLIVKRSAFIGVSNRGKGSNRFASIQFARGPETPAIRVQVGP